ncbi:MAG: hydrogenase maturation nickel metallochaperone HypA [Nanoarchaeota archaeon]|nr:hydrogenase maturation nickel metallochaperone HypA [Nanoarchaeota archaeon]
MATQEMVRSLLNVCQEKGIEKPLKQVDLEIGELTTYEKEPFHYYYDLLKKEHSLLAESVLSVEMVLGKLHCEDCGSENFISKEIELFCKECGGSNTRIIQGKDIIIKKIEI